jgi:hypothetical protein
MRKLLLALAAAALAAGCATPCEELGNRICGCVASGTTRTTCEAQVSQQLKGTNPDESYCSGKLETCNAPSGQSFCDWIKSAEGKVACGYAYPEPAAP